VSKFAHGKFLEFYEKEVKYYDGIVIDCANHFSRACWNQPDGKQRFEDLLREHWVKKNPENIKLFNKLQHIHSELRQKFNVEKEQECFSDEKGNYLSCLYFKVKDSSFCCESGVRINHVDFWTCFYKTGNSKEIPALEGKGYEFTPDFSNDIVADNIEKLINQVIEEVSKTY